MATNIKIKNIPTGYQSIISNGKHSILGDEPIKSKGTDLGLAPTELLLAGIAMCKVATVRHVARRNGWEIGDVDADLSLEVKRGKERSLSSTISTKLKIEGNLTEEQKATLLKEAGACYVQRMVEGDWNMEPVTEWIEEDQAELVSS